MLTTLIGHHATVTKDAAPANKFDGGRIFLEATPHGWNVNHEPARGGVYTVGLALDFTDAHQKAEARANQFGATVFMQIMKEAN